jgi:hypothetical protein
MRGNKLQNSRIVLKPPQLKTWRVSLIRKRGQILGDVEAPNRDAAEAAAIREFSLTEEQRRRLVVQERL